MSLDHFLSFIQESPTSYHCVQTAKNRLVAQGFIPLDERQEWTLQPGSSYVTTREGSLAAFTLPLSAARFKILGAHSDSPALKLKAHPVISSSKCHQLLVDVYGAPLLSSWLNRDLAIAGKITFETVSHHIQEELIFLKDTPCLIPQLAIHLDKEVNDKGVILNKHNHLRPLFALGEGELSLESLLPSSLPLRQMLAADLFLVPLEEARQMGLHHDLLASYRLDNLTSSYACLEAISKPPQKETVAVCFLWDAEEIGSHTTEGASSSFAPDILCRIRHAYGWSEEKFLSLKASSLALSIDVAHGFHPSYPQKFDEQHQIFLGKGIAVKHSSSKRYMTDQKAVASVILACQQQGISYQHYAPRSDMASGSTIGPIFGSLSGIPTADIGIPLLSMHSIREVISQKDHHEMCQLLAYWIQT
ncbi:MAG: M18 family aminopeptidase [Candidatus Rhabdochlamydia sp.]